MLRLSSAHGHCGRLCYRTASSHLLKHGTLISHGSKTPLRVLPRYHRSHSHFPSSDPQHHHDDHHDSASPLLIGKKSDPAVKITRIGLLVNLALVVVKGVGGVMLHSSSLVADAGHSLADILSDVLTLSTLAFAVKPATALYPLGFGKVETLGALGVSSLLFFGGAGIGISSLEQVLHQVSHADAIMAYIQPLVNVLGHDHHHHFQDNSTDTGQLTNVNAAWVAAGSIVVKEWLFRRTMKISIDTNSTVLAANVRFFLLFVKKLNLSRHGIIEPTPLPV
jgi:hypothetical protein